MFDDLQDHELNDIRKEIWYTLTPEEFWSGTFPLLWWDLMDELIARGY